MAKKNKILIVGIIEKEFFKYRVVKGNVKLGEYLYDCYINLLEAIGTETEHGNIIDVSLFTQVESSHKCRFFEVDEKAALVLNYFFRFKMTDALEDFSKDCRKEGGNLLMQLNSGELSLKDFDDTLKQ